MTIFGIEIPLLFFLFLLHAQRRWPDAINSHLWTYAIRAANDSRNYAPTNEDDTCPMSKFCNTASVRKVQNQASRRDEFNSNVRKFTSVCERSRKLQNSGDHAILDVTAEAVVTVSSHQRSEQSDILSQLQLQPVG